MCLRIQGRSFEDINHLTQQLPREKKIYNYFYRDLFLKEKKGVVLCFLVTSEGGDSSQK